MHFCINQHFSEHIAKIYYFPHTKQINGILVCSSWLADKSHSVVTLYMHIVSNEYWCFRTYTCLHVFSRLFRYKILVVNRFYAIRTSYSNRPMCLYLCLIFIFVAFKCTGRQRRNEGSKLSFPIQNNGGFKPPLRICL